MSKVLLTGGSGFIATHILDQLLKKGYPVVTTVRSEEKASKIREAYPEKTKDQLDIAIVSDIAQPDAFDEVVKVPGLEVVLHTASPFHFKITDPKKDLVDPAVIGTTGILKAIARSAPGVKRVVVTSSFAAILDPSRADDPTTVFSEDSWSPVTLDDIYKDAANAYRASKKLAEKAAWDFVADPANGAKFDLVTVNPPLVFGPPIQHLASLSAINTSNQRILACIRGDWKAEIPPTGLMNWVDVRNVATAHVMAGLELPEAAGKRLFATTGVFSNRDIVSVVRKRFPGYAENLPGDDVRGGEIPPQDRRYKTDNSKTAALLGIEWIPFEQSIADTVQSLKEQGA